MIGNSIKKCTGCSACFNICPMNAIKMEMNEQGFLYPFVEHKKCIDCKLCEKVCPINKINVKPVYQIVYAGKHKNREVKIRSSSGGVFTALSDFFINNNGIVYGCAYDKKIKAEHIRATNFYERDRCCGSKYVQSDLGKIFGKVKIDLDRGILVLFSGTPCQIDGLNHFLGKEYDNLFTMDFVCHGTPSPKLFADHVLMMERLRHDKIYSYNNRSKVEGWGKHIEEMEFSKHKKEYKTTYSQAWKRLFYSHNCLRESCYQCKYTNLNRVSDITVGDLWGMDKFIPNFLDALGVSLIIVNSIKGINIMEQLKKTMELEYLDGNQWIQPSLKEPVKKPKTYDIFWDIYEKKGYIGLVNTYANCSVVGHIKDSVKKIIHHRNYIP